MSSRGVGCSGPLVSVLMPARDHEPFVAEAILSVVRQSWRPLELVVIDDGSADGTGAVCRELAGRHDWIRFESQPNAGVGATVNRLLERARGEYVAFLASDDAFETDKLLVQVEALERNPALDAVFSHVHEMDRRGQVRRDWTERSPFNLRWRDEEALVGGMLTANRLCATTCLMRASVVPAIGRFETGLQFVQDYDYWLRLLKRGRIAILYERLTRYRRHDANLSSIDPAASCDQTCRVLRRHVPALIAAYPATFVRIKAIYARIAALAYEARDWQTAGEFLGEFCEWFAQGDEERTRLLVCLLQLGRHDEARRLAAEMLSRRLQLRPEIRETVTRLAGMSRTASG